MAKASLPCTSGPGSGQHLACGQCRANGDTAVDADHLTPARSRNGFRANGECNVPPSRAIPVDPVGLYAFRYGPRPTKSHPANLGNPDFAGLPTETVHVPGFHGGDPEAFIAPGFTPRGPAVRAAEEVCHRLGEVAQRLLLHHLTAVAQPHKLGTGLGELPGLLEEARRLSSPRTPPRLL